MPLGISKTAVGHQQAYNIKDYYAGGCQKIFSRPLAVSVLSEHKETQCELRTVRGLRSTSVGAKPRSAGPCAPALERKRVAKDF